MIRFWIANCIFDTCRLRAWCCTLWALACIIWSLNIDKSITTSGSTDVGISKDMLFDTFDWSDLNVCWARYFLSFVFHPVRIRNHIGCEFIICVWFSCGLLQICTTPRACYTPRVCKIAPKKCSTPFAAEYINKILTWTRFLAFTNDICPWLSIPVLWNEL